MLQKTISIVVPVFNEEDVIQESFKRLIALNGKFGEDWSLELIFVDDGSSDRTFERLSALSSEHDRIKIISFSRNFGHQIAITAGTDHAEGDYIAIIDADLQDPPELIVDMLRVALSGYDVVAGKRINREGETWFKKVSAAAFYRIINLMSDINLPRDTGDFRLFSRKVADAFSKMREKHRYVRGMFPWLGFKTYELEYERKERFAGETKYPLKKMIRLAFEAILSFSSKPIELTVKVGLFFSSIGFLGIIYILYIRLFSEVLVPGLATIICMICLFSGLQLVMIGIVGLYVARIFEETKGRPLYVVSHIIEKK